MSRAGIIILLGILTILTPFSGLPVSIRTFLTVVFGACVIGIGIAIRSRDAQRAATPKVESVAPHVEPASPLVDGML